jgi:hypothetical protein
VSKMEKHEPRFPVACCEARFATFPTGELAAHSFRQRDCVLDRCPRRMVTVHDRGELNAIAVSGARSDRRTVHAWIHRPWKHRSLPSGTSPKL